MKILGIDPGSNLLGFAILENKKIIISDEIKIKKPKYFFIYKWLQNFLLDYTPDVIMIEHAYVNINFKTSLINAKILGSILVALEEYDKPIYFISPSEVKKVFTLKGNAKKSDIRLKVQELFEIIPKENEADAIAISFAYYLYNIL